MFLHFMKKSRIGNKESTHTQWRKNDNPRPLGHLGLPQMLS